MEDFPVVSPSFSVNFIGSNCWTVSGFTARLLIPLDIEVAAEDPDAKVDMFEAELVAANIEEETAPDFFDTFVDRFDKLLSLTGICCLISCFSIALLSLAALIKCKLANDSFFKLPPVMILLEAVNMALPDEVKDELFLIEVAEPPPDEGAKLVEGFGVEATVSLYRRTSPDDSVQRVVRFHGVAGEFSRLL